MRWKALRSNLVLLAVSIVLSLIIGMILLIGFELLFLRPVWDARWNDLRNQQNTEFDPELGWKGIPNRSYYIFTGNISSNSLGGRGEEVDYSKEHILVIGDSVAWGLDLDDKEAMPYYLNEYMEEEYPRLQVLNMAVSGYGIDQYYMSLDERINLTNPRLIIVVIHTGTDFEDTSKDNAYGRSKPFFAMMDGQLVNLNPAISKYSCYNLFARSRILERFDEDSKMRGLVCGGREHTREETEELIKRLVAEIGRIARDHNSGLLFVISPREDDFAKQSYYLSYFRGLFRNSSYDYLDYYGFVRDTNADPQELYLKGDMDHYNPEGNRLLAETIFSYIKEKGLLEK